MRLPTPREPELQHHPDPSDSSRQSSMKWLPVPSVPRCGCPGPGWGCFDDNLHGPCQRLLVRPRFQLTTSAAVAPGAAIVPTLPRCGRAAPPARSTTQGRQECRAACEVSEVRTAIMPQPMSTPTAAGIRATADHRAHGGADAPMHVGHRRHVVMNER